MNNSPKACTRRDCDILELSLHDKIPNEIIMGGHKYILNDMNLS